MRMSGAMSKRTFKIFQKTLIIITILCEIIFIALTLTLTITDLLMKMSIDFDVTSIYIVVFVVFIAVMTFQTVMFMFLGIRLLYVVKNQSLHSKQSTSKRTPCRKIIGLIIGMVLSAFLQILAGAVSFATTLYVPYLHIIDYFLQCFGIFIFAVFVLLLYGPLMSQENMSSGTEEPIGSNPPTMQQHLSRVTTPFTPMSPEDVELELNRKIQNLKV
ncbi:hypothetical protein C9374_011280 [Naegleria lovaniensis]|uniref:Uncharacterized protein n=1 Tax=Naegleria lovaniensis TaxID=51637 RepID=A0AA88GX26_NAELO|nr:uncharacterized protein C9374_011280 [Naegleria lovaniensis]KAG2392555.1 hypothetical protein C9374_011280 [Naegleria lovaniensis]